MILLIKIRYNYSNAEFQKKSGDDSLDFASTAGQQSLIEE